LTTTNDAKAAGKTTAGFTDDEKAAMKERARELKAASKATRTKADGETDVLAKIEEMAEPDRSLARRFHELVKTNAPSLLPKTWYGMPAYAKGDKVVCFFQSGQKFKTRYSTFGFSDAAELDDGNLWSTGFALTEMNAEVEAKIAALVKKAVG
jgi:uncharacterized protein YdhG (YjbR/CyaY superfamily)